MKKKLSNEELITFCGQMALILKSGISSLEGIYIMEDGDVQTDVSTDSPPLTAVTLAPFPKWHTMIFKSLISFPKTFAVSKDTN